MSYILDELESPHIFIFNSENSAKISLLLFELGLFKVVRF